MCPGPRKPGRCPQLHPPDTPVMCTHCGMSRSALRRSVTPGSAFWGLWPLVPCQEIDLAGERVVSFLGVFATPRSCLFSPCSVHGPLDLVQCVLYIRRRPDVCVEPGCRRNSHVRSRSRWTAADIACSRREAMTHSHGTDWSLDVMSQVSVSSR